MASKFPLLWSKTVVKKYDNMDLAEIESAFDEFSKVHPEIAKMHKKHNDYGLIHERKVKAMLMAMKEIMENKDGSYANQIKK